MDEVWSGDRAVLTRVVELYKSTGEEFQPEWSLGSRLEQQRAAVRHSLH
jgi:hypothetical protein